MSWRKNLAEYKMHKEEKIKKDIQENLLVDGQRIGRGCASNRRPYNRFEKQIRNKKNNALNI